jgi:hypothetical protein
MTSVRMLTQVLFPIIRSTQWTNDDLISPTDKR